MNDLALVLIGISILFALFIYVRTYTKLKACALCAAVSLTWIVLLVAFYLGGSVHILLLGILVGTSITGISYLLEEKLTKEYLLFKLPFFLTLVSVAYMVIEKIVVLEALIILATLWIVSGALFVNRDAEKLKGLAGKIISCCKNW